MDYNASEEVPGETMNDLAIQEVGAIREEAQQKSKKMFAEAEQHDEIAQDIRRAAQLWHDLAYGGSQKGSPVKASLRTSHDFPVND